MILKLTENNFKEEVLDSKQLVIVDFWASWCGPCKMLAPVFEEVSNEYGDKLKFAKLSTEDCPEIASANQITGIPCLIIYNRGKEVDRIIGFNTKEALKRKIDEILEKI